MIEHDKHLQMNFNFQCNYKFINKLYIHYLILLEITEIVVQMSTNKEFKSPKKRKRNAYDVMKRYNEVKFVDNI